MTDTPLKPCPFCAKPAETRGLHYVACSDHECFLSVDVHVDTWNNRPLEEALAKAYQLMSAELENYANPNNWGPFETLEADGSAGRNYPYCVWLPDSAGPEWAKQVLDKVQP
jgi:hypothetical protein